MTREEAIERVKTMRWEHATNKDNPDHEAMTMAIKALEQEPCDDCVSRQAVLDEFKDGTEGYDCAKWTRIDIIDVIEALPPVLPKREQGKWRQNGTGYNDTPIYECSQCGRGVEFGSDGKFKCCPYCGAEMR